MHGALSQIFGLVELLQRLSDLLILDFTLTLLLVVIVQAPALQLLQMMLEGPISDPYGISVPSFSTLPCLGYLNVFDILISNSLQWVDEVLLHIDVQRIFDLGQPQHGLPKVHKSPTWNKERHTGHLSRLPFQ